MIPSTVERAFSSRAASYDEYANVQRVCALRLAEFIAVRIERGQNSIASAPVLEIGCGTGFLTEYLISLAGQSQLVVSDASRPMLEVCRERLTQMRQKETAAQPQFWHTAAEQIRDINRFRLITSSFTLQWVSELENCIERLYGALVPGGSLMVAVPTDKSFEQWKAACAEVGVPYSGNSLPNQEKILQFCQRNNWVHEAESFEITSTHSSSREFFQSLKRTGAAANLSGIQLTYRQMHKLLTGWAGGEVTFSILNLHIKKRATND